ncbi:AAA-like domain-containing protein [Nostoc sp. FACHB-152]|uniref:AAA-like domain-containing protein n=1 Tax=unclassified Nostoc TaxID=2593658 RepID=UPI0016879C60|nr:MULTISPECIES: AAA-like domain-containing protein [unclassified Nostoc]MBD2447525.1 AAA-like domain-containing protein [Nostoc sp. FACHB-152]MBD2469295.1 AAA-like domain-containing protein [Nostoc sp. FACHB-145]
MSWDLVKACTVAIATPEGNIQGTGFFISSTGHLLTCAHVVESVGGWTKVRINGRRVELIYLGDRTSDDFAILQLPGYQGASAPISLNFQPMDRFLSIGYGRLDFPLGASIDGTITDMNSQSEFGNLPMLRLRVKANSQQVQGGYSGSPVFDAETQRVIGLIAAYDNTEGALALPLSTVLEKWSNLSKFIDIHLNVPPLPPASKTARVFISYRSQDPDLSLAQNFYEAIKAAGHQVFMAGESIRLGENWPQRIDRELERCDYFLLLLSPQSATSEMVTEEVRRAKQLQDLRSEHKPVILPIRVNFPWSEPLNYDLRGYLNQIQQREWKSPADTSRILHEVLSLLAGSKEAKDFTTHTEEKIILLSSDPPMPVAEPELPEGQVDLASKFYVERPPIESRCHEAILKPGSLIRIKAPRQMGKTSLMARILHQASQQDYLTVPLSFQLADGKVFADLDKFLQWFCASIGRRLKIPNKLTDYWDEIFGSKDNCTAYFEEYLLAEINQPLVLGLDEVDCVFQYPEIAADFFGLLRAWHEDAKNREIWKKLRLVVVHSTEVYIPLNINQSPFNVGLPIELPEFNAQQVLDLAQRHGLDWNFTEVEQLMRMVGGHPYLVRVALYRIARKDITLDLLLQKAPTEAGPYSDHLRRHLWNLEQRPELAAAIKKVVATTSPVRLDSIECFKLLSMGLLQQQGNDVTPRCNLYRQYFRDRLRVS